MISTILRRSSSIVSRRTLAASTLIESVLHHQHPLSSSVSGYGVVGGGELRLFSSLFGSGGFRSRAFHGQAGPLNFRASLVSRAEYAVDDYPLEEGHKGNNDESLEVAKLGISQDIVSALAKRGITKLFPIQVCFISIFYPREHCGNFRVICALVSCMVFGLLEKKIQLC